MIEEALLTRARPRLDGRGNRFLRQAFLPARGLDDDALVRTRGRQVFVTTPFDVLACRTAPEDIPQLTTKVSLLIDGPSTSSFNNQQQEGAVDGAWLWPGALPPETGFALLDMVDPDDALALTESIRHQVRGLTKVPAQLLDQESLVVSGHGIPNRMLLAAHAMGFLPCPLRVSTVGNWIRVDCVNGTLYFSDGALETNSLWAAKAY